MKVVWTQRYPISEPDVTQMIAKNVMGKAFIGQPGKPLRGATRARRRHGVESFFGSRFKSKLRQAYMTMGLLTS
jgi:hypothetical protein